MQSITAIKKAHVNKLTLAADIDAMIEAIEFEEIPSNKKSRALTVTTVEAEEVSEQDKVVLDLQTIWPIVKAIFTFVRPLLIFNKKWRTILDRFIAGIDVIIPEKE